MASFTARTTPGRSKVRSFQRERTELWEQISSAGRKYQIAFARPKQLAPPSGYPVLYVLDPDSAFLTLADIVRIQERMFGPAVVVGIGYQTEEEIERRIFDLSPPTDPATLPPAFKPEGWGPVGGADVFLDFLLGEVRSTIAQRVLVDPARQALFGHSLGGLFVLHTLFTRPDSFNTYIAGSPPIWWGDKAILKEVSGFKSQQECAKMRRRLLITMGGLEDRINPEERPFWPKDFPVNPDELVCSWASLTSSMELADDLRPLASVGLDVEFALLASETHCSVIPAYLARGARFTRMGWLT